jgi:16S rRNA (guanine(966)-N(2))-methyltransferase RsmD
VRIISGEAKGRTLKMPRSDLVRPTADRVRETIFNVLGQQLSGERVLDLYAGAGGLGLEALSRGAGHATFVENAREVMPTLAGNVRDLGFASRSTTLLKPVERALPQLAGGRPFDLVFADPPYAQRALTMVLEGLDAHGLVAPGGTVVLEHDKRESLPERVGSLARTDERRFGDTAVSFYERG